MPRVVDRYDECRLELSGLASLYRLVGIGCSASRVWFYTAFPEYVGSEWIQI